MSPFLPDYISPTPAPMPGAITPAEAIDTGYIFMLLGYRPRAVTEGLRVNAFEYARMSLYQRTRVTEILLALTKLDKDIADAIGDAAITKTCNSEMDWKTQIALLRREGHQLLLELSRLFEIPLEHSKYAPMISRHTVHYQ